MNEFSRAAPIGRRRLLQAGLSLVAIPAAHAESKAEDPLPAGVHADQIRSEVGDLFSRVDAAWNAGDADAFAANWIDDGTVINPMGALTHGRAAIATDIGAQLAGPMKGSRHKLTAAGVYGLGLDVAVADGVAEVGMGDAAWPASFTAVLSKEGEAGWKIAHMRSYVFLPPN